MGKWYQCAASWTLCSSCLLNTVCTFPACPFVGPTATDAPGLPVRLCPAGPACDTHLAGEPVRPWCVGGVPASGQCALCLSPAPHDCSSKLAWQVRARLPNAGPPLSTSHPALGADVFNDSAVCPASRSGGGSGTFVVPPGERQPLLGSLGQIRGHAVGWCMPSGCQPASLDKTRLG